MITQYFKEYDKLKETYKIAYSTTTYTHGVAIPIDQDKYDIIVESIGTGYAHAKYRVVKNGPGLTTKELAIICDRGNLCFGYRVDNGIICVYTD